MTNLPVPTDLNDPNWIVAPGSERVKDLLNAARRQDKYRYFGPGSLSVPALPSKRMCDVYTILEFR